MIQYETFINYIMGIPQPVVLLEGTREVPKEDISKLTAFARWLAGACPDAIFRSGNAKGSDEAFAEGVRSVAPDRLELMLPVSGHRKKNQPLLYAERRVGLDQVSKAAEGEAAALTSKASPIYEELMAKRHQIPSLRAKANYLIRDTTKVTGIPEAGYAPADFGIFYANLADPMKGGTGHTIRVCQERGVPVALQDFWMGWSFK